MPEITTVGSVQDAVELAQDFKGQGRYNWFRGQVRDWPPVSSLHRLYRDGDEAAIERMRKRYALFTKWLRTNPTLSHLLDDGHTHQFFAIAQHYGIPTHYIDFTTDPAVAGFFATDTRTPPTDGMSCIYCLDKDDLLSIAKTLKDAGARKETSIETIEVDVTNLWRLQAQRGVFLFCEYNWDIDYPMDRILFPYTGYPSYPPHDYVYPTEKSALEHLLDQYFDIESKHFGHAEMLKMIADLQARGTPASLSYATSHPGGFYAKAFVDAERLTPLASWSRSRDPEWQIYPGERYDDVRGHIERIYLPAADRLSVERAIAFGVKQVLDASAGSRAKLVEWTLDGATGNLPTKRLSALFGDAWNRMRSLPFSNAQIAAAFSAIASLVSVDFGAGPQPKDDTDRFSILRGEGFRVEFAYADGSSSRGCAAMAALKRGMRRDLKNLLVPEYQDRIEELDVIFQLCQNPTLLFDFEPFVDIFARDLIPSQIVLCRKPILFNPAVITRFGLP